MKKNIKIGLIAISLVIAATVTVLTKFNARKLRTLVPVAEAPSSMAVRPSESVAASTGHNVISPKIQTTTTGSIPESVRPIIAPESQASFQDRARSLHALPASLGNEEIEAIYAYLRTVPAAENRQYEHWLINEIMDKLADSSTLPPNLATTLVSIYKDTSQDVVVRDYAVQHISPVYSRSSEHDRQVLKETLWQAIGETDSSIAGTALLVLSDLAQQSEFDSKKLGEAALEIARNERCGELARITALQVCARMGANQAAPIILDIAKNSSSAPLQVSAIGALGEIGNSEARKYLRELSERAERRFMPAIENALKKIDRRLGI